GPGRPGGAIGTPAPGGPAAQAGPGAAAPNPGGPVGGTEPAPGTDAAAGAGRPGGAVSGEDARDRETRDLAASVPDRPDGAGGGRPDAPDAGQGAAGPGRPDGPPASGRPDDAGGRAARAEAAFREAFGRDPEGVWAAPGRINLIGEHTDYNDGFVLPFALPHTLTAAAARRGDGLLRLRSLQSGGGAVEIPVAELEPGAVSGWAAYPAGSVWALREAGHPVGGMDLLVDSAIPTGAGLSSSAALTCATVLAAADLHGLAPDRWEVARTAQRAENDFVGMPCGLLDQSAVLLSTEGRALFLDVRSLETEQVPFDPRADGLTVLTVDTRAPHRLVGGMYAERRRACEHAARVLGVPFLRDVPADGLAGALAALDDPVVRRRVRHVVTENARVLETVALLRAGRLREIGPLLTASHTSLRDDYEVSVPEVDTAVEAALSAGALGARITGGGYGGCVIALVESDRAEACAEAVRTAYAAAGFAPPAFFHAAPSPGARRVLPPPA